MENTITNPKIWTKQQVEEAEHLAKIGFTRPNVLNEAALDEEVIEVLVEVYKEENAEQTEAQKEAIRNMKKEKKRVLYAWNEGERRKLTL